MKQINCIYPALLLQGSGKKRGIRALVRLHHDTNQENQPNETESSRKMSMKPLGTVAHSHLHWIVSCFELAVPCITMKKNVYNSGCQGLYIWVLNLGKEIFLYLAELFTCGRLFILTEFLGSVLKNLLGLALWQFNHLGQRRVIIFHSMVRMKFKFPICKRFLTIFRSS